MFNPEKLLGGLIRSSTRGSRGVLGGLMSGGAALGAFYEEGSFLWLGKIRLHPGDGLEQPLSCDIILEKSLQQTIPGKGFASGIRIVGHHILERGLALTERGNLPQPFNNGRKGSHHVVNFGLVIIARQGKTDGPMGKGERNAHRP